MQIIIGFTPAKGFYFKRDKDSKKIYIEKNYSQIRQDYRFSTLLLGMVTYHRNILGEDTVSATLDYDMHYQISNKVLEAMSKGHAVVEL